MPSSGQVRVYDVVLVLRAHGVQLTRERVHGAMASVMVKGDVIVAEVFSDFVGRRVLQLLQRRFGIPIHHFYHPLMAPAEQEESIQ